MDYRLRRWIVVAPYVGMSMVVLAGAVFVGVFLWFLEPFAGKTTSVQVNAAVSLSLVANLGMGAAYGIKKRAMDEQSGELNRLRGRVEEFERSSSTMKRTR